MADAGIASIPLQGYKSNFGDRMRQNRLDRENKKEAEFNRGIKERADARAQAQEGRAADEFGFQKTRRDSIIEADAQALEAGRISNIAESAKALSESDQALLDNMTPYARQIMPSLIDLNDDPTDENIAEVKQSLLNRRQELLSLKQQYPSLGSQITTTETDDALAMLESGDYKGLFDKTEAILTASELKDRGDLPKEVQSFMFFQNLNDADQQKYLNLKRATVEQGMQVTDTGGVAPMEGFTETKTDIAKQTKSAEKQGAELGAAIAEFEDLNAALPQLEEVVGDLRKLASLSTYKKVDQLFNSAKRQFGLEVGTPAEARAQLIATIDNEVLPLLRPTFGAAFTVNEGEWLRKTLGDPDATDKEIQAALDARVASWNRQIRTKAARAGKDAPDTNFPENPYGNILEQGVDKKLGGTGGQVITADEFLNE